MPNLNRILFLIMPLFIYGDSLRELIEIAESKNDLVIAKQLTQESKAKELDSKNSAYFPTLDLGGFYKRDDDASPFQPGSTYSGYAKLSYDIYDGGKRSARVDKSKQILLASELDTKAFKESLALQITQDFFTIKSLEASLKAKEEAQTTLKEQLIKIERFVKAKMATSDDLDRVQADFDTNTYQMESIKFQILSSKSSLSLKVGKNIHTLDDSSFSKMRAEHLEKLDANKALIAQQRSIEYEAESIDSFYYPHIKIEDTYSIYGYDEKPNLGAIPITFLENQNTLMLTLNFRVFDYGAISDSKETVLLASKALSSQIAFQTKEQEMQFILASSRIQTAKVKILSSKSALNAATNAFETIEKKYNAGIVDYIIYLDSLSKKTSSKALYESGLNELEIAYAIYYYYSGKNIKGELQCK
jgi:outer membrane protein TolC